MLLETLAMDAEAIIILQSTGVFLGKKDYAHQIKAQGFPPLEQLMEISKEEGGNTLCVRTLHAGKKYHL